MYFNFFLSFVLGLISFINVSSLPYPSGKPSKSNVTIVGFDTFLKELNYSGQLLSNISQDSDLFLKQFIRFVDDFPPEFGVDIVKIFRELVKRVGMIDEALLNGNSFLSNAVSLIRDLSRSVESSTDLTYVKKFIYGPSGIAYSIARKNFVDLTDRRRHSKLYDFRSLFAGLLGDIEKLVVNSFVFIFKTIFNFVLDSLQEVLEEFLRVVTLLLPVFERLVDIIVRLVEQLVNLIIKVYLILDKKYFLTEACVFFVVTYYFLKDIYMTCLVLVIVLVVVGIVK